MMAGLWKRIVESRTIRFLGDIAHIANFLWLIAGLIGIGTFVGFLTRQWGASILAGTAGAALTGIIALVIVERNRWRKGRLTDWNPRLYVRERRTHVIVSSPTEITYRTSLLVDALQDDVDRLYWRVGWTGSGTIDIVVRTSGLRHELAPSPVDNANTLCVRFSRPCKQGDQFSIEFDVVTKGTDRPQQPFYSMTLYESRLPRIAAITVEFAPTVTIGTIEKETYASDTAAWPMDPPVPAELDRNRTVVWNLRCERGRRYCVRWSYG